MTGTSSVGVLFIPQGFKQEASPPEQEVTISMAAAKEQPCLPAVSLRILLPLLLPGKSRRTVSGCEQVQGQAEDRKSFLGARRLKTGSHCR